VRFLASIFLILIPHFLFTQIHYRVSADFTIKETNGNIDNLSAGKIYYDITKDILVYNMYFPEKLDWIIHDTSFFIFREKIFESRYTIPKINTENILYLSLTSNLNDYGISNTDLYDLVKTVKEDELVISTYKPKTQKLSKVLGKIIISLKEGKFNGIVFFSPEEEILKKLIIQQSQMISGILLPSKILEINYRNNNETYKITSFSNFKLNETENEEYYNYDIHNYNR